MGPAHHTQHDLELAALGPAGPSGSSPSPSASNAVPASSSQEPRDPASTPLSSGPAGASGTDCGVSPVLGKRKLSEPLDAVDTSTAGALSLPGTPCTLATPATQVDEPPMSAPPSILTFSPSTTRPSASNRPTPRSPCLDRCASSPAATGATLDERREIYRTRREKEKRAASRLDARKPQGDQHQSKKAKSGVSPAEGEQKQGPSLMKSDGQCQGHPEPEQDDGAAMEVDCRGSEETEGSPPSLPILPPSPTVPRNSRRLSLLASPTEPARKLCRAKQPSLAQRRHTLKNASATSARQVHQSSVDDELSVCPHDGGASGPVPGLPKGKGRQGKGVARLARVPGHAAALTEKSEGQGKTKIGANASGHAWVRATAFAASGTGSYASRSRGVECRTSSATPKSVGDAKLPCELPPSADASSRDLQELQGAGSPYKSVNIALNLPSSLSSNIDTQALSSSSSLHFATMDTAPSSSSAPSAPSSSATPAAAGPSSPAPAPSPSSVSPAPPRTPAPFLEIHEPGKGSTTTPLSVSSAAPPHVQIMTRHAVDLPREPVYPNPAHNGAGPSSTRNSFLRPPAHPVKGSSDWAASCPTGPARGSFDATAPHLRMVVSPLIHVPAWCPPITKASMEELELVEVLKNAQLRHDVVFDEGLRFRPNLDGDRGLRKRLVADRYWTAIAQEIIHGCRCTAFIHRPGSANAEVNAQLEALPCVCEGGAASGLVSRNKMGLLPTARIPSRLTSLLSELRAILLSLLPPPPAELPSDGGKSPMRTHDLIAAILDPTAIINDLTAGTLDLPSLADFLGVVLKNHCAPMRDHLVDNMIALIGHQSCDYMVEADTGLSINLEGLRGRRYVGLAGGLRLCFEILELMKLDIANHQLRTLRPLLLDTALEFELKQFSEMLRKKPSIEKTKMWYLSSFKKVAVWPQRELEESVNTVVRSGLLDLVLDPQSIRCSPAPPPSIPPRAGSSTRATLAPLALAPAPSSSIIPETLHMDTARLQSLHSEMTDLLITSLLLMLFSMLAGHRNVRDSDVELLKAELSVFTADIAARARAEDAKSRPSPGLKRLNSEPWRTAMKDVLLHVAARAETVKARGEAAEMPSTQPPSPATIRVMESWVDNHLRSDSQIFKLVQSRLRQSVEAVLADQIEASLTPEPVATVPAQLRAGRATAVDVDEIAFSIARRARAAAVQAASGRSNPPVPRRTRKRSTKERERDFDDDPEEGPEKRSRVDDDSAGSEDEESYPTSVRPSLRRQEAAAAVEATLARNGLSKLGPEIRSICLRMSKLITFHLRAFRPLYSQLDPRAAALQPVDASGQGP